MSVNSPSLSVSRRTFVRYLGIGATSPALYRDLKKTTGQVYVVRPTDLAHWHAGGTVYYNRQDPALFVESPVGAEYTTGHALNLGNSWAYPLLCYLAALPVVLAWSLGVF